jgi:hypothetical protein
MSSKLLHLRSSTAGLVPGTDELTLGQIAINTADKKLFILCSDGTIAQFYSGDYGTVTSVNSVAPVSGNVTLTPTNLGATTIGNSVFTATSVAGALTALGATSVGSAVFTATNQSTAVSALGATAIGSSIFTAASTGAVQTAIGATATGSALLTASSVSAAVSYLSVIPTSQIGAASGVAPLDVNSKVPLANLPSSIIGGVNYQGSFIPGTTTLPAAASGNKGWYYIATAAGTYTPPGSGQPALTFGSGDWIISDGIYWGTVENTALVSSVNGQTGAVVLAANNITTGTFAAAQLGASPGNNDVLTTGSTGLPAWVATLAASQLGASPVASAVLTTNASSIPTWVAQVPASNLPVGSATQPGIAQAGTGLSSASGVYSVNTSVLTMDEGNYSGT